MRSSERQDCRAYLEWTQYQPDLKGLVVHHVNEGKRSNIEGKILVSIGLSKGLPDFQIFVPNKNWHSLFIEMKVKEKKNHTMPVHQVQFINKLLKQKYYATFAFGLDEAIKITTDYLNNII